MQQVKAKVEMNYFSLAKAPRRQKLRDTHVKSILSTYNTKPEHRKEAENGVPEQPEDVGKESTNGGSPEKQEDQPMANEEDGGEDVGFVKANKFRAKPDPTAADYFEGIEGFKLSGTNAKMKVNLPSRSEDF